MFITWDQYKNHITTIIRSGKTYYFRGQRRADWKLQTTFHRHSELTGMNIQDYLDRVLPEVAYHCSSAEGVSINLWDFNQYSSFLAKLQHHGFPTPLLDWSLSPYVAAYFALKDLNPHSPDSDHVIIYIFDIGAWTALNTQPFDFKSPLPSLSGYRPFATNNQRMTRQLAVTTATNVSDLGVFLTSFSNTYLYQLKIPASERQVAMNDLNMMGINSMTMFPDFDGVCAAMKEVFFNNISVKPLMPVPPPPSLKL